MRFWRILGFLLISFLTGFVGVMLGGHILGSSDAIGMATGIVGFLIPSVCLIVDNYYK